MRTAIVGSGAMGQLFGAHLLLAGHEVVFIDASPRIIDALNERGVTLHTEQGTDHSPAQAAKASDLDGEFELFIIFTKGFHTQAAVDSIAHLVGPDSYGLTLQNGLGNEEVLQRVFGENRTLLGMTDFPADLEQPGVISSSTQGKVRLGSLSEAPRLEEIAQILDDAGLHAAVDTDIRSPIWEKVAFNAALNTISAVTGLTVGQIGDSPHARGLVVTVLDETLAVADHLQINASRQRIEEAVASSYIHHAHHKTSMLTDLEANRPTEVDTIGGAVVRIGQENGVAAPVLNTLCDLVRTATLAGAGR